MTKAYEGAFLVQMNGQTLDLPTGDDTAMVFQGGQRYKIINVYALVTEAIKCATTQAVVDIGTAADPDAYVDGWEPDDNAAVDDILTVPAANIVGSIIEADTKVIAKVVTAGAEGGAETGQVDIMLELVAITSG